MLTWQEIKNQPEVRRLFSQALIAVLLWVLAVALLISVLEADSLARQKIAEADTIIQLGSQYRAYGISAGASTKEGDELTVVTEIIERLGLREKVVQIGSAQKGVSVQVDGLYRDEFENLLAELSKKGISIKSAELRALPVKEERLWNVNLVLTGVQS